MDERDQTFIEYQENKKKLKSLESKLADPGKFDILKSDSKESAASAI